MSCVFPQVFSRRISSSILLFAVATVFCALTPATSLAQRTKAGDEPENRPAFSDFKGVHIGTPADEARKKLGNPRDKGAEQDFYMFGDNQAVQVFYDKGGAVNAISIDFMSGANGIPSCKDVLGADTDAKADGSIYKLVRYPKAGYWVSYSRTGGSSPTVTITMQKVQ